MHRSIVYHLRQITSEQLAFSLTCMPLAVQHLRFFNILKSHSINFFYFLQPFIDCCCIISHHLFATWLLPVGSLSARYRCLYILFLPFCGYIINLYSLRIFSYANRCDMCILLLMHCDDGLSFLRRTFRHVAESLLN